MDKECQVTKFTREFLDSIPASMRMPGRLPDEQMHFITFKGDDYRSGLLSHISYNFLPRKIHLTAPRLDFVAAVKEITERNPHLVLSLGQTGWLNDDFMNDNITQEFTFCLIDDLSKISEAYGSIELGPLIVVDGPPLSVDENGNLKESEL